MNKYSNPDIAIFKDDGFGHIRLQYRVPAMRGVRVQFEGRWGTITGVGQCLIVRPDVRQRKGQRWLCHPTYKMVYHPTPAQQKACDARRKAFWKIAYPDRTYPERY